MNHQYILTDIQGQAIFQKDAGSIQNINRSPGQLPQFGEHRVKFRITKMRQHQILSIS